jgi:SHS family lactate transporter-like MFS transporter
MVLHRRTGPRSGNGWTGAQKRAVIASYLGWTLDAFDFFLLVFVLKDVASAFAVSLTAVAFAITLTLALRPLGAFIFGRLADRYGRRRILLLDVALYAFFAFVTAFAPSLPAFLVIRALFGVAMGGEWGIGAALAMESIPAESRGLVSGILQSGYPSGYLLASVAFGLLYPHVGWRGMFAVGLAPALLILYIRVGVDESPTFERGRAAGASAGSVLARHWKLAVYAVLLMTALNFLGHGTLDLYPTFLLKQRHLAPGTVSLIAVTYNIGGILGGLALGAISQRIGRRRAMLAPLLALPVIWLWAFAHSAFLLAIGAFVLEFFVEGTFGVIPAHLSELSPPGIRASFTGTVYQLGNLIASSNAVLQTAIAERQGGNFALALAGVAIVAALALAGLALAGPEARHADLASGTPALTRSGDAPPGTRRRSR